MKSTIGDSGKGSSVVDPTLAAGGSSATTVHKGDSSTPPPALFEAVERVGGPRAIPAQAPVLVHVSNGVAQLTVQLDITSFAPPTFMAFLVRTRLGAGWTETTWSEVTKSRSLALQAGHPEGWPTAPVCASPLLELGGVEVYDLIKRHQAVVTHVPSWPRFHRLMLSPLDAGLTCAVSANPYQVAWEPVSFEVPERLWLPGAAFRPLLAQDPEALSLRLGLWAGGGYLTSGPFTFWSDEATPFPMADVFIDPVETYTQLTTTALDIRRHVRNNPGEERDSSIGLTAVEFHAAEVSRSALAAVGKHLRGRVTVEVPGLTADPIWFRDEHGATHYLSTLRPAVAAA